MAEVTIQSLYSMLQRQGFKCALTGRPLTPENCTLDHIEPYRESGTHALDNVQLVVSEVNAAKGTMSQRAFVELCRDVTRHQSPIAGVLLANGDG